MNVMRLVKVRKLAKKLEPEWIWLLYIAIVLTFVFIVLSFMYYDKIPSKKEHAVRNKRNVLPANQLKLVKDDYYMDDNHVIWIKRAFYRSLFHNPLKYYVFETIDSKKVSSSEAVILTDDFDKGKMRFEDGSFNYYSSYNHPIDYFFADVLPIALYFGG